MFVGFTLPDERDMLVKHRAVDTVRNSDYIDRNRSIDNVIPVCKLLSISTTFF